MNIRKIIKNVYASWELNTFKTLGEPEEPLFEEPLVGVAAGDDEYFKFLKRHIGEFHWTPMEAFALKYKEEVNPSQLRVISMVFPQNDISKKEQNSATIFPCDHWVVSRGEWEPLMQEFSGKLVAELEKEGYEAVSIDLQPQWKKQISENQGLASYWSHRHYAYAAGMGTFGLSDGFISERGKAIRITSLIIKADIPITPRGDRKPYDWCLFYRDGSCGACIKRCSVDAISKERGHNKNICAAYEDEAIEKYWPKHIERGDYIFGCGLCQSKVPCQNKRL